MTQSCGIQIFVAFLPDLFPSLNQLKGLFHRSRGIVCQADQYWQVFFLGVCYFDLNSCSLDYEWYDMNVGQGSIAEP